MSGEIIQLSNVMSLIFECRDLSQASVSISHHLFFVFLYFICVVIFFLFFNGEVLSSEIYNVMQKALKKLLSYIKVFIEDGYHLYHIKQEPSMTKAN